MKRTFKKLFAALLAAALVLAMAVPAFAVTNATKGSITIDGISLTVARVDGQSFAISAIPHTVSVTTLAHRRVGDPVNLETDVLGKYVEKLLQPLQAEAPPPSGITRDFLTRCGF